MGFTPDLVTGVWVGGEERYIHFNSMALGQGARAALPVYGYYMQKVYGDKSLPYKQESQFVFTEGFAPCGSEGWGERHVEVEEEDVSEGIFE